VSRIKEVYDGIHYQTKAALKCKTHKEKRPWGVATVYDCDVCPNRDVCIHWIGAMQALAAFSAVSTKQRRGKRQGE